MNTLATVDSPPPAAPAAARYGRIPLWIKVAYTAFLCVLVPHYWKNYGPANFLFFCDAAMLMALAALWLESRFLVSLALVAMLVPGTLWAVDLVPHFFGVRLIGMTDYMFEPSNPVFNRSLSLFHLWLPALLLYATWRLGYDRRAWLAQCGIAWALMLVCFFSFVPPSPTNPTGKNINYVFGFHDDAAQTAMPPAAWFALLMVALPLCAYLPAHLLLRVLMRKSRNGTT